MQRELPSRSLAIPSSLREDRREVRLSGWAYQAYPSEGRAVGIQEEEGRVGYRAFRLQGRAASVHRGREGKEVPFLEEA
jgi:hypothetical protein